MALNAIDSLSEKDWEFVKKLTKVGNVQVLSHQVSILFRKADQSIGTDENNKLIFPQNWSLQYVGITPSKYETDHIINMTWEILKTDN